MTNAFAILATAWICLIGLVGGCAASSAPPLTDVPMRPTVSLLFDRYASPGALPASDFTGREVWPSAGAGYAERETITYQELLVDRQGPRSVGFFDQTYRRVRVRREGAIHR